MRRDRGPLRHDVAMITADEVLAAKFQSTKFTEGYDQDEVDDFLDRVVTTLRARETGVQEAGVVTVADLDARSFTTTKFREGYSQGEVDALLDRVRLQLGGAPSAAPSAAGPGFVPPVVADVAPPVVVEEKRGFWRRLFGG
jgi:DivIVA domain-containing protein